MNSAFIVNLSSGSFCRVFIPAGPASWPFPELSEKQWERIKAHLPARRTNAKGGRPWADDRKCFEGILWMAWASARWDDIPDHYGSAATCWRRLRQWQADGVIEKLWRAFVDQLELGGSDARQAGRRRAEWTMRLARLTGAERKPRRTASSAGLGNEIAA